MEERDETYNGREEGIELLNELNLWLLEQGRVEDIAKAARDKHYQEQLFREFGLVKDEEK